MIENLNGTRERVIHPDNLRMRFYINEDAEDYPIHWHTDNEIIMPVENIYTVIIDRTTYVLNPGDIMIIPSGEIHELIAPPTGKRIITLFDNSIFNDLYGIDSIKNYFYPCTIIRAEQSVPYHQQLVTILEQIADEYSKHNLLYEASIYSLFINFFVIAGRNCIKEEKSFPSIKSNKQHTYIEKVHSICKYIDTHCTEDISLDALAALAGFSKYHFSRLFHEFSGMSIYDYLMRRRIIYAESLLCDPNLSIIEIAMQSGFNSMSSFNRNFRKIKKCTPKEYRQLYRTQMYHDPSQSQL
jgi:AraC-like DNA-binding protein